MGLNLYPPQAKKQPPPERVPEIDTKTVPKVGPEEKPKPEPQPIKKPEPEKKLDLKPKPIKKPEPKPEPEKKPEVKPEPEKKPEPKPKPLATLPKPVVSAPAPKGTLSLLMPETLNLQPGGTKLLPIKVVRTHCEGPVSITFEGLPSGVELKNATVAAGKQKIYLLATASANAEEKEWQAKVIGVSGSVRQEAMLKIKIAK